MMRTDLCRAFKASINCFLIGKHLSRVGIPFVELSGKVPVKKRQSLIDEFSTNPDCKVFLSTDAGGTGLNLQAADCVINFELPWNLLRLSRFRP